MWPSSKEKKDFQLLLEINNKENLKGRLQGNFPLSVKIKSFYRLSTFDEVSDEEAFKKVSFPVIKGRRKKVKSYRDMKNFNITN